MQIEGVIRRPDATALVISGFPSDLDWSDGTAKAKDSLIIQTPDKKLYRIHPQNLAGALGRLQNQDDNLAGLLKDEDLFLELPLHQGDRFCDAATMARDDSMYCLFVDSATSVLLDQVKGAPPGRCTAFTLNYRSHPDDFEFDFVPGLGMTSYSYHHHGTVADTELKLVEFLRGNGRGP